MTEHNEQALPEGGIPEEIRNWIEEKALSFYMASSYEKPLGKTMWMNASRQIALAMYNYLRPSLEAKAIAKEVLRIAQEALATAQDRIEELEKGILMLQKEAASHKNALNVCVQGLIKAGLPYAAEPIQMYLALWP